MSSDNPTSADNQQERPGLEQWVVGFVDGEGCIRKDNHRHPILRLSVKGRSDLTERVIPFFEANPLITAKRSDFEAFTAVIHWMTDGVHLTESGLGRIAQVTETMNRRAQSRYLESSEAIRRPPHLDG